MGRDVCPLPGLPHQHDSPVVTVLFFFSIFYFLSASLITIGEFGETGEELGKFGEQEGKKVGVLTPAMSHLTLGSGLGAPPNLPEDAPDPGTFVIPSL